MLGCSALLAALCAPSKGWVWAEGERTGQAAGAGWAVCGWAAAAAVEGLLLQWRGLPRWDEPEWGCICFHVRADRAAAAAAPPAVGQVWVAEQAPVLQLLPSAKPPKAA